MYSLYLTSSADYFHNESTILYMICFSVNYFTLGMWFISYPFTGASDFVLILLVREVLYKGCLEKVLC